jgi:transposase InsO family protein
MKAISKSSEAKCSPTWHNPDATHIKAHCFELYPDQKAKMNKRREKGRAKAKKASTSKDKPPTSANSVAWHSVRQAQTEKLPSHTAYLDSGASHHMIADKSAFTTYSTDSKCKIELADGQTTVSPGKGYVYVKTESGDNIKLECLHVPQLVGNLISQGRLWRNGCDMVRTGPNSANLVNEGTPLFKVKLSDSDVFLIKLEIVKGKSKPSTVKLSSKTQSDIEKLHRRAGHPSNKSLKKMFNLPKFELLCEACSISKSHRLPYQLSLPETSHCLESVHFDLSGRIDPPTSEGYEYYFKITDLYSSYKFVYLLKKKSEVFGCFEKFHALVTNLHSCPIKKITTDGGEEFNSTEFKSFLASKGITPHITAPYTPQQNPVAERGNRTTTEKARTMLNQASLPLKYWGHAVGTAVFLENVTPTRKKNWKSAYEIWFHRKFEYARLRPFGCRAYVNLPKSKRGTKFEKTATKGVMLGYQLGMHNWRILREDECVELSNDVTFDKSLYPGISTFDPAGLLNPPLVELFDEQEPLTPETPPPAAESHQSTDDDNKFECNLRFEELPDDSKEPAQSTSLSRI